MNFYALFISLIGIIIIHFGYKLAFNIQGLFKKLLIEATAIIVSILAIAFLSLDVDTSTQAGRYFFFVVIGYFLLYHLYIKTKWKTKSAIDSD